jgi:hypothetical protein
MLGRVINDMESIALKSKLIHWVGLNIQLCETINEVVNRSLDIVV